MNNLNNKNVKAHLKSSRTTNTEKNNWRVKIDLKWTRGACTITTDLLGKRYDFND